MPPMARSPSSPISSPAMMRSSVVLPEPEGPSSARSSPGRTSSVTPSSAIVFPKRLLRPAMTIDTGPSRPGLNGASMAELLSETPFEQAPDAERHEREEGQQRGDSKRADGIVILIEREHLERHGHGEAADLTRYHRDGTELSHRARIAQQHAINQRPADIRQG